MKGQITTLTFFFTSTNLLIQYVHYKTTGKILSTGFQVHMNNLYTSPSLKLSLPLSPNIKQINHMKPRHYAFFKTAKFKEQSACLQFADYSISRDSLYLYDIILRFLILKAKSKQTGDFLEAKNLQSTSTSTVRPPRIALFTFSSNIN